MSLVLEYRNTHADFVTHHEVATATSYLAGRSAHHRSLALWVAVVVLGGYAAYRANEIFILCILSAVGLSSVLQSVPFARRYWAAVERSLAARPETTIRLKVGEDGMHESVDGIESFAPWTSVKRFTLFRDTLFIELAAGLCAIVPRSSVSEPTSLDALIQLLRDRGIAESPSPRMQRKGVSRV